MVPAGWAAFPSVSCYKPEQKLSANLQLYSQNSVFICGRSATKPDRSLCFCVDNSPASLSVIQKPGYICFECIVSTYELNTALHVHSVLKEIKYFIQLQIKLILCVCSDFYGPIILKKNEVGRRTCTCKSWYVRRQPFVCFFQTCLDCVTAIVIIQVVSIRLQKDGYQLCFIFEVKRCFLREI